VVIRALILAVVVAFSGCGGDEVTEIFVCYEVEPDLRMPDGELRICATATPDGRPLFGCDGSSIGRLDAMPQTQGYVRRRADGVRLELAADVPGTGLVTQSAAVPFQADRIVDVVLRIERACLSLVCPPGQTCGAGRCLPEAVDPTCLADHGGAARTGCTDPRVIPGCAMGVPDGG
jgi:hypothetical protein